MKSLLGIIGIYFALVLISTAENASKTVSLEEAALERLPYLAFKRLITYKALGECETCNLLLIEEISKDVLGDMCILLDLSQGNKSGGYCRDVALKIYFSIKKEFIKIDFEKSYDKTLSYFSLEQGFEVNPKEVFDRVEISEKESQFLEKWAERFWSK